MPKRGSGTDRSESLAKNRVIESERTHITSADARLGQVRDRSETNLRLWEIALEELKCRVPFRMSRFTVRPHTSTKPDQHEVDEIWAIVKGSGVLRLDGRTAKVRAPEFLHFSPMQVHEVTNVADSSLDVVSIWWRRDG